MSWGLEGFLDIFVRGGGVAEVLPECSQLLVFAAICLSIAVWQFARRMANVS
jgi:ABC-2 type transport system permease protein